MPTYHSLAIRVVLSVPKRYLPTANTSAHRPGATSSTDRQLDGSLQDTSDDHVLREHMLLGSISFMGIAQTPYYLIRVGEDLFETTHELNEGSVSTVQRQFPVRTLSHGQAYLVTGHLSNLQPETAPIPSSRPGMEGQRPDCGNEQSHAVGRSSFGRLLKRKSSPSSFSMRTALSQPKSTVSTAPTNAATPANAEPLQRPTSPPTVQAPVQLRKKTAPDVRRVPVPLTLTVTLSPPSWSSDPSKKSSDSSKKSTDPSEKSSDPTKQAQDIKIDVFLNGEFANSRVVRARSREASWGVATETFSGRRVSLKQERAWVIVPPGQYADGSTRIFKRAKSVPRLATERWEEIGQALLEESDRWGYNIWGDRSCVGSYLEALAKSEMPRELEQIQKPNGQKFGVLDVVISMGKVGMRESNYLRAPQRSLDSKFSYFNEGLEVRKSSENVPVNQTTESTLAKLATMGDNTFAFQGSSSPYSTVSPIGTRTRSRIKPTSAPALRSSVSKLEAKVSLPKSAISPSAHTARLSSPRPSGRISAEQKRRLKDLKPKPPSPRQDSTPIPIETGLHPDLTPSITIRSFAQNTSGEPGSLERRPGRGNSAVTRDRSGLPGIQDDGPAGKRTIIPQKRYRHTDNQDEEAPPRKRRTGDDLSTTLTDNIWAVDGGTTQMGFSRQRSGRIAEPGIAVVTPCLTNFKSSIEPQRIVPRIAEKSPFITGKPRASRPSSTSALAQSNAFAVQLSDPFYIPPPKPLNFEPSWEPSPLSQDSVLTYAEGDAWEIPPGHPNKKANSDIPAKKGDAAYKEKFSGARDVRTEKGAEFEESSVLVGVRFILA